MTAPRIDDSKQYSDLLHTRKGKAVTLRFVEPGDAEQLQNYFRSLSARSRYNRFLGGISELPRDVLDHFIRVGECNGFSVIATMKINGFETIVGEARYALHPEWGSVEFGISIDDHWQRQGLGAALVKNIECRAAALGAVRLFGDTLRSNEVMVKLARKSGYAIAPNPDDWKLVRFEKHIDVVPEDIPCASWRLAAASRHLAAASLAN
ncbi:MAG TPA: GNAT family N-acetyltransferase [Bradyrhizobium sp.]|nr:GNAT family N-acetyltransferase [Bradyrhizobium sp.]